MWMLVLNSKWVKMKIFGSAWIAYGPLKIGQDSGSTLNANMSNHLAIPAKFVWNFVQLKGDWSTTKLGTTGEQPISTFHVKFSTDFDDLVKSKTWKDEEGKIRCADCDYSSQFLTNVKNHIEAHHVQGLNQGYSCSTCYKVFKSKNSYQTHKSRFKGKCIQPMF